MTPDQLSILARAMGHEVKIDSAGVVRVLASGKAFRPADDVAQAWHVLCWLMGRQSFYFLDNTVIETWDKHINRTRHDNTPAGFRRAVVEAAVAVAVDL